MEKMNDEARQALRRHLYDAATWSAKSNDGPNAKAFVEALMMLEPLPTFERPPGLDSGAAMPMGTLSTASVEAFTCRCIRCEAFVEKLEPWREATDEEKFTYPSVRRDRKLVAKARCNDCNRDVLAIQWASP